MEAEVHGIPRILVAALSIGFDAGHTLLPYNQDGIPNRWIKNIDPLSREDSERKRKKAVQNVLYFLQSRFPSSRTFHIGTEKYSGDHYILNKNYRACRIEFPSILGDRTYIIRPEIYSMPNGKAVLRIKEKGGDYIGFFVITDESRSLPDIEEILSDETLMYPALSEQRKIILKDYPELKLSNTTKEMLQVEGNVKA